MSEKRFINFYEDGKIVGVADDNDIWLCENGSIVDLLNELNDERMMYKTTIDKRIVELQEENRRLKKENDDLEMENDNKVKQLQQQLDFIKDNISNAIPHQKTELEQKALKRVISDYNDWLLGHNGEYE